MANLNGIVRGDVSNVASETINSNTMYDLQDLQPISITNTQMTNALTNAKFYKKDSVWFCIDSGTYTQNHFYKFTVTNPYSASVAYSWTDLGGLGGSVTTTTDTTTTAVTLTLATNNVYRYLADVATLTISFPTLTTTDTFDAELSFKSGSTATTFSTSAAIKWTGDDTSSNTTFTPVADKTYDIMFWWDGAHLNAVVRGV